MFIWLVRHKVYHVDTTFKKKERLTKSIKLQFFSVLLRNKHYAFFLIRMCVTWTRNSYIHYFYSAARHRSFKFTTFSLCKSSACVSVHYVSIKKCNTCYLWHGWSVIRYNNFVVYWIPILNCFSILIKCQIVLVTYKNQLWQFFIVQYLLPINICI